MSEPLFAGVDAGSSATKCVLVDAAGRCLGHGIAPSGFDYAIAADQALNRALDAAGAKRDRIERCVSTGYGRERVEQATRRVTEITCHARGAFEWYPQARTIVDIGGQDTKVIRLNAHGHTADYRMNAKCAAGTGTFLESIAVRLALPLSEIDGLAMRSTGRLVMNSYCTVFTSTEVLERIKEGQPHEEIAMGLFRAIASRVAEMMSARDGAVAATGGVVTHCRAMVKALEEVLGVGVLLPPLPQHAGAFGAALLAMKPDDAEPAPRSLSLEVIRPC
ncbi:MAG: ATPase [Phycisphaerae bacterium]|nr:ATPase [Phycisphaerae bacterium]